MGHRVISAFSKTVQLSAIGATAGVSTSMLGTAAVALRHTQNPEFRPSVPIPHLSSSASGLGIFMGFHANLRYQLINGIDRCTFERVPRLPIYLATTTLARAVSHVTSKGHQQRMMDLSTEVRRVKNCSHNGKKMRRQNLKPKLTDTSI